MPGERGFEGRRSTFFVPTARARNSTSSCEKHVPSPSGQISRSGARRIPLFSARSLPRLVLLRHVARRRLQLHARHALPPRTARETYIVDSFRRCAGLRQSPPPSAMGRVSVCIVDGAFSVGSQRRRRCHQNNEGQCQSRPRVRFSCASLSTFKCR